MYALLNEKNIVIKVIMADHSYIEKLEGNWVKGCIKGKNPKNYPGLDYTYVPQLNAFLPPKPGLKYELGQDLKWKCLKKTEVEDSPAIPGSYEELLKDNNGKQVYESIATGPNKQDIKKVPVKIQGIVVDVRK